ncbi:allophanate hydrolase-related protein [Falsigemmobacter faecalis]|uniref:Allophanate hydrolase C-terminal domain-containing protein n=1 Tax=Falsigemmobacter faecalis TaxID=2488730 RepID=A0A3P3DDJ8_9RHOB|nr:hypothetical protein [Falsigemmobacter faecalis]RRH72397.1 hypothetical protein EG244_14905 [Falsigemmobacter faecalis]
MTYQEILLAVCGAHLSGMALNHQLTGLGAELRETTTTAADYQLYALNDLAPPRPGLQRVAEGTGHAIEVEIWALSPAAFGAFVAAIPVPMAIGMNRLIDGRWVKGFVAEPIALGQAEDISRSGGWRGYCAALTHSNGEMK